MKLVRPGKEFTFTARVRDPQGNLADPEKQSVTLVDAEQKTVITIETPERVSLGIYRVRLLLPKDAKEGIWHVTWYIQLDGRESTSVTDIQVKHKVVGERALEMEVRLSKFSLSFFDNSSIILEHGKKRILVDIGQDNELPDNLTEIVLSHAHPDHSFGLKNKSIELPVYLNKFSNRILSRPEFAFRRKIFWRKPFMIGDVKITPIPVLHSVGAPASGFILEAEGKKIACFPEVLQIRDLKVLEHCDLYIGDGATLDKDIIYRKNQKITGHASVRTQLKWLQRAGVKRAIFTHYGKWAESGSANVRAVFKSLGQEFNIQVWEASDGWKCYFRKTVQLERGKPGIYLVPPHARLIAEGLKTIIISTKPVPEEYLKRDLYFLQDKKVYGVLQIPKDVEAQDAETVRLRLASKHQISAEEWNKWWPEAKKVYAYPLIVLKLFLPPKDYSPPAGVQKWIRHVELEQQTTATIQNLAESDSPFAPVHSSGEILGDELTISEVLQNWEKPIILKKGYITLMGGLPNRGKTQGDIDVLIAEADEIAARDQPTKFRLGRSLGEMATRLKIRYAGEYGGVFTSHVPVYDLVLVPSEDRRLVQMSRVGTLKDTVARQQASQSLKEKGVKPLRFVTPLKGYKGYYKVPELVEAATYFEKDQYPVYGQKKYDGVVVEWMKDGDTVIGRTDDGFDVTKRFPTLVKIIKETWPETLTVLSETEMWVNGQHQPREIVSGYMMKRGEVDDSKIVSNVFDVVYFSDPKYEHHELSGTIGDLHDKPYELRYKYLELISWQQKTNDKPKKVPGFNLTPNIIIQQPSELINALETLANFEASEGAVLKSSRGTYELDGLTRLQIKWKKMAEIHAIVLDKVETRTPGVFNLKLGVGIPSDWSVPKRFVQSTENKDYLYIGKTFNVAQDVPVGSIITLTFHTLNHYVNEQTNEQYVTAYEPRFIEVREQQKQPDSAVEVIKIAREKELLSEKSLQQIPMDDDAHQAVLHNHYRGKSAHMDFRIRVRDTPGQELDGFTLFHQIADSLRETVETVEQAKSIEKDWNKYFKLQDVPQTDIPGRRKIRVELKLPEPKDWLKVEKVMPVGEVGATKEEEGVFSIVDRPTVYLGAQKTYFKEFFIEGKLLSGRWIINYLPNPWSTQEPRTQFVYLMWKPEDQTPYVLASRAVKKKWVPPFGVSSLPPSIRNIISEKFKYWNRRNINERLAARDELVSAIQKGEVKLHATHLQDPPTVERSSTVKCVLQHYWERGQFVVRGGPSKQFWLLRMDTGQGDLLEFILSRNPLVNRECNGKFGMSNRKWMDIGMKPVSLKPGEEGNPSKNTPAFIQTIDSGSAQILESNNTFMKVKFALKQLKNLWIFQKRDPHQNLWVVSTEREAP